MTVTLMRDGASVSIPDGSKVVLYFNLPAGYESKTLAVLVWDSARGDWVELPGVVVEKGMAHVESMTTGTFVLVMK